MPRSARKQITFQLYPGDMPPPDSRLVIAYPADGLATLAFHDGRAWRLADWCAMPDPACWHERVTGRTARLGPTAEAVGR